MYKWTCTCATHFEQKCNWTQQKIRTSIKFNLKKSYENIFLQQSKQLCDRNKKITFDFLTCILNLRNEKLAI